LKPPAPVSAFNPPMGNCTGNALLLLYAQILPSWVIYHVKYSATTTCFMTLEFCAFPAKIISRQRIEVKKCFMSPINLLLDMELGNTGPQRVLGPLKNDKVGVVQQELLQSKEGGNAMDV